MTEYNPRLVAPTCLYLAAKAEESTVQARLLAFYIKKVQSKYISMQMSLSILLCSLFTLQLARATLPFAGDEKYRCEIKEILEMEMKILEALNYYLVVFHPYRALTQ